MADNIVQRLENMYERFEDQLKNAVGDDPLILSLWRTDFLQRLHRLQIVANYDIEQSLVDKSKPELHFFMSSMKSFFFIALTSITTVSSSTEDIKILEGDIHNLY